MPRSRILFLCPYPSAVVASQRFRFEQYFDILAHHGFACEVSAFMSEKGWQILRGQRKPVKKVWVLLSGFVLRYFTLLKIFKFEFIFIHREAAPVGPPVIEWMIAKIFRKKIIYDFDDSLWLTDNVSESAIQKSLKWRKKISLICKWSYKISAGNEYLASFARQFNSQVVVNPTTIDLENLHNNTLYKSKAQLKQEHQMHGIVIGWTGSYTTLKYLERLFPVLQKIEKKFPDVKFLIIADRMNDMLLKNLVFKKWSKQTEISDLLLADIGIMPLPDDEWAKGKCGFKALQYMALEIPAVVSPVGVNTEIVEDGAQGYWCLSEGEWLSRLERLIVNHELRQQMGKQGRQKVARHYSVISNSSNFVSFFQ